MPLYQNVISGNINILIFGGICLICCFALSGRKNWIPLILAFCTTIKIYPALLMATFVKRRDYRACISFCFFTFLLAVLSIGIFGLSTHLVFSHGLPSATKFIGVFHSMSFTFILKLFLGDSNKNIVFIANLFFLVLLLLSWWQIARKYPAPKSRRSNSYSRSVYHYLDHDNHISFFLVDVPYPPYTFILLHIICAT